MQNYESFKFMVQIMEPIHWCSNVARDFLADTVDYGNAESKHLCLMMKTAAFKKACKFNNQTDFTNIETD